MEIGIGQGGAHDNRRMSARFAAFVVWAAVAASAVFWALRLWSESIATPPHATVVSTAGAFQGDAARVLGGDAPIAATAGAVAPADSRFKLVGVVAPRDPRTRAETRPAADIAGVALIATDGKPAKAYRVGAAVEDDLVLQSVRTRAASLGPRGQPAQLELLLPTLPPPATAAQPAAAAGLPAIRPGIAGNPAAAAAAARAGSPPLVGAPPSPPLAQNPDDDDGGEPQPMPRAPAQPNRPPS